MLKLSLASLLSHFPVEPFCNFYSLSLSLWFIPTHFVIVHFSIEPVFGFSFCSFCPSLLSSLKLAAAVASFFHLFLTKAFAQARDNFRPPLFFLSLIHWVRARANSKGALPESNFETLSRSPKVSSSLDLSLSLVPSIVAARTRNSTPFIHRLCLWRKFKPVRGLSLHRKAFIFLYCQAFVCFYYLQQYFTTSRIILNKSSSQIIFWKHIQPQVVT